MRSGAMNKRKTLDRGVRSLLCCKLEDSGGAESVRSNFESLNGPREGNSKEGVSKTLCRHVPS